MIKLKKNTPLAQGKEKYVFQHPNAPDLLIKVWKEEYHELLKKKHRFFHALSRHSRSIGLLRELTESIVARESKLDSAHTQEVVGVCDTDLGTGLIVRAVQSKDKNLASTLAGMIDARNYLATQEQAFEKFLLWLTHTNIIIRDLNVSNIVWNENSQCFVIIDGLGARPVPSIRNISKNYNKRTNKKKVQKLLRNMTRRLQKINSLNIE